MKIALLYENIIYKFCESLATRTPEHTGSSGHQIYPPIEQRLNDHLGHLERRLNALVRFRRQFANLILSLKP